MGVVGGVEPHRHTGSRETVVAVAARGAGFLLLMIGFLSLGHSVLSSGSQSVHFTGWKVGFYRRLCIS